MTRIFCRPRVLPILVGVFCLTFMLAPSASAGIISITQGGSCSVYGLDTSTSTVRNGVHCVTGGTPFSLQAFLNGQITLYIGDSTTPSWNFVNDTGAAITSFTFYYGGSLASNASIDPQLQGSGANYFTSCTTVDADGTLRTSVNCGTGDISQTPAAGLTLPLQITFTSSGTDQLGINQVFNIHTSSFAHAGQDNGQFYVPPPDPVPDGGTTMTLLGVALAGMGLLARRLR